MEHQNLHLAVALNEKTTEIASVINEITQASNKFNGSNPKVEIKVYSSDTDTAPVVITISKQGNVSPLKVALDNYSTALDDVAAGLENEFAAL